MKNKLSISLIAVTLSCAFTLSAYASTTESDEDTVGMEMSENEVKAIQEECREIGIEDGAEGDDLTVFVDECFAANTMVLGEFDAEDAELATEDQDIPGLEDETMTDTNEPMVEDEEAPTESMS